MKKIVSVIAALSVAAGMLTGCGEKKEDVAKVRIWSASGSTKQFMTDKVVEFNKNHRSRKRNKHRIPGYFFKYGEIWLKALLKTVTGPELVGLFV